jgi:hypothetical protein
MNTFYENLNILPADILKLIYDLDNTYHKVFGTFEFKLELSYMSHKINRTSAFENNYKIYPNDISCPNQVVYPDTFQIYMLRNIPGCFTYNIVQNKSINYGRFNSLEQQNDVLSVLTSCIHTVLCNIMRFGWNDKNIKIIYGTATSRVQLSLTYADLGYGLGFNSYSYNYTEIPYPLYDDDDYDNEY